MPKERAEQVGATTKNLGLGFFVCFQFYYHFVENPKGSVTQLFWY